MQGHVDSIGKVVVGWAFDPTKPATAVTIRVVENGSVLAEGPTGGDRPDVEAAFNTPCRPGFELLLCQKPPLDVAVQARDGDDWVDLPIGAAAFNRSQYQSFEDEPGASRSQEKLDALKLPQLRGTKNAERPLEGRAVLDLGCNEGFFCLEALKQGAERVVGVDANADFIAAARERSSEVEYICGSWWDLPPEQFDVILWLSAMHYEPRPRPFLDHLKTSLRAQGTLVLECGAFGGHVGDADWQHVIRADGPKRYPSLHYLQTEILRAYASKVVGRSPLQSGDPVPRFVLHCQVRRPIVLLIAGAPGSGKTTLARQLETTSAYHIDQLYSRLLTLPGYGRYAIARLLRARDVSDFTVASAIIVEEGLVDELVRIIADEIPIEADLCAVEGHALIVPEIHAGLVAIIQRRGAECWTVERALRPPTPQDARRGS